MVHRVLFTSSRACASNARRAWRARAVSLLLAPLAACSPDYAVAPEPSTLVVSPGLIDAGVVRVGSSAELVLTLTHTQGADVTIVATELTNVAGDAFVVDGEPPASIGDDEVGEVHVRFTPGSPGWHYAQLEIKSDADQIDMPVVELRGRAVEGGLEVWPAVVDFGAVTDGGVSERSVTLFNDSDVTLTLDPVVIEGSAFSAASGQESIAAGASLTLPVTFAAAGADAAAGRLSITAAGAGTVEVILRGNDCAHGTASAYDVDADGKGVCANDCDDGNASVRPGAAERCDGVDENCDGVIDDGTACVDDDGDGRSEDAGDCNDGDPARSPTNTEIPANGIDDDCDGAVDDSARDADADGYATAGGDCDDAEAGVFPGATEASDGADNDCDGQIDEGTDRVDDDRDGLTEVAGDCDDADASVYPGAAEAADWVDDDCDGAVDEGTDYADDDGDGFTEAGGDCDDADASRSPGARETVGNGTDDDCDGVAE